jgi:hypothetical protein
MRNVETKSRAFMLLILAIKDALTCRLQSLIFGKFPYR